MTDSSPKFWELCTGPSLAQGDLLPNCLVPIVESVSFGNINELPCAQSNLIVLTQTCDLENNKAPFVALCPHYTLREYEDANELFSKKGVWEQVRNGRRDGLHMLGGFDLLPDGRSEIVVDFRMIHSLPINYLESHAAALGDRWRLQSPYLEHFSQAFARFFMRVGLPSQIPRFK